MERRFARRLTRWGLVATGLLAAPSALPDEALGQSPSGQIVRPGSRPRGILAKLFSSRTSSRNVVQSPADGSGSAVSQHLQALYARDGREMPVMSFGHAAEAPPPAAAQVSQVQSLTGVQQAHVREDVGPPIKGSTIRPTAGTDEADPGLAEVADPGEAAGEIETADAADGSPYTGLSLDTPPPPAEEARASGTDGASTGWIAARTGQTALQGYCPVALRDRRELVEAVAEWTSSYEGQTWRFSSAEAKSTFDAAPEKYVPAARGCDAVMQQESGVDVPGTLDHALWFRGRLYLFHGPRTMASFASDPTRYAE